MTRTDIVSSVVEAVAAADGVDTGKIEPIYEYIDPGVLKKSSAQEEAEWSITFQYSDHQVTVTHEAQIFVDGNLYAPEVSTRDWTDR